MATGYEDLIPQRKATTPTGYEDLIPKPSAAAPTTATPTQRRPAFLEGTEDIPRMLPKAKSAPPVQREEEPKIGFTEVVQNDNLFNIAQNYLKASGQPAQEKDESREDVINRFMSEQRFARLNTTFGAIPELSRIVNATPEVKKSIAEGRDLYDKMASAYDEGGQGGVRPVLDVVKAVGYDIPLYAGTAGVGALGGKATTKLASDFLIKRGLSEIGETGLRRGATAGIGVMEGAVGAAQEATEQRTKQEEAKVFGKEPEPLDATRIAAVGLFSAVVGAGVPLVAGKVNPAKVNQQGQALAQAITREKQKVTPTNPNAPLTPVEQALVDPLRDNMDQVHDQYMKLYGKELLNIIDPTNALTDSKVRTDMSKAAVRIALRVVQLDDAFKMKPNEQISSALNKVFARLDKVDSVVLEKALDEEGITKEMFAAMNKATVSDAARVMQQYSAAARALKAMTQADPDFDKLVKNLYTYENDQVSALGKIYLGQQRLAREWKAIITSGVDTTARNALSTAIVVPLKTGIQLMEGTAYSVGKAMKATSGKRVETLKRSMGDTIHDAFDVYAYMWKSGVARESVDAILKGNPSLRDNINNALQETGDRQVSAITKWANVMNVTMDSFVRRAVFTSTVERELRRQNKNLYLDFLDKNIDIPAPIIKQAMKEALQTTYAYVPKAEDKAVVSSLERGTGTAASVAIRWVDKTPFLNFAIPFPRYMSNAMAFFYRYSPAGAVGATEEFAAAHRLAKQAAETGSKETMAQSEKIYRSASEKFIQSAVGTAALAAAYEYRKENPDVPWYEVPNNDGETVDIRGLGNPANYFAVADIMARVEQGTYSGVREVKDAIESVVGMKVRAGSGDTYIDRVIGTFESETKMRSFFIENGKFVGDIAGGFTQPFVIKQLVDFVNLIRDEGRVVRDPNVIESESTALATVEAAGKRVMGKLPVLKEQLPEAVVRLTPEELSREGEFFNRLIGFRQTIQRSPLESEIVRLNLDPYELYGAGSGDREYDRAYIKNANELITNIVPNLLRNNNYRMLPDDEKLIRLSSAIKEQASIAREKTKEEFKASDLERVYKMRFNKLPARLRRSINRRYAEDNNGVNLEEAKDWFMLDKYEAEVKARTGGLSEQTDRAFGR